MSRLTGGISETTTATTWQRLATRKTFPARQAGTISLHWHGRSGSPPNSGSAAWGQYADTTSSTRSPPPTLLIKIKQRYSWFCWFNVGIVTQTIIYSMDGVQTVTLQREPDIGEWYDQLRSSSDGSIVGNGLPRCGTFWSIISKTASSELRDWAQPQPA